MRFTSTATPFVLQAVCITTPHSFLFFLSCFSFPPDLLIFTIADNIIVMGEEVVYDFSGKTYQSEIRLTDFSKTYRHEIASFLRPNYVLMRQRAPELFLEFGPTLYHKATDVWTLGMFHFPYFNLLLYISISNNQPLIKYANLPRRVPACAHLIRQRTVPSPVHSRMSCGANGTRAS